MASFVSGLVYGCKVNITSFFWPLGESKVFKDIGTRWRTKAERLNTLIAFD